MKGAPAPSRQSLRALDGVNLCLADVMLGIGPFTAAYLQAERHWDPAQIGAVMSASGLAAVVVQTPAGAVIDAVRRKRELLGAVALVIAAGGLATLGFHSLAGVAACQVVVGAAGAFLAPTLAAITLGLVGHGGFDRRMGRNQMVNHAGTVAAALLAGLLGWLLSQAAVFYLRLVRRGMKAKNLIKSQYDRNEREARFNPVTGSSTSRFQPAGGNWAAPNYTQFRLIRTDYRGRRVGCEPCAGSRPPSFCAFI